MLTCFTTGGAASDRKMVAQPSRLWGRRASCLPDKETRRRDAREPHRLGARATPEAIVYPAGDGELTGAALPAGKTPAPESGAGEESGEA
jgi:hypothetical protein